MTQDLARMDSRTTPKLLRACLQYHTETNKLIDKHIVLHANGEHKGPCFCQSDAWNSCVGRNETKPRCSRIWSKSARAVRPIAE